MSATIRLLTERMEDGGWFASSLDTPGCWGSGPTESDAMDDYCLVLPDWFALKIQDGDDDVPPLNEDWTCVP